MKKRKLSKKTRNIIIQRESASSPLYGTRKYTVERYMNDSTVVYTIEYNNWYGVKVFSYEGNERWEMEVLDFRTGTGDWDYSGHETHELIDDRELKNLTEEEVVDVCNMVRSLPMRTKFEK